VLNIRFFWACILLWSCK